jgi:hypothetical protein
MIMRRIHVLIEDQPINAEWVGYLDQLNIGFRDLANKAQSFDCGPVSRPAPPKAAGAACLGGALRIGDTSTAG